MAEHLTPCPHCGAALRWRGDLVDQPRCVCGHLPPRDELEHAQRIVDDLLAELLVTTPGAHRAT